LDTEFTNNFDSIRVVLSTFIERFVEKNLYFKYGKEQMDKRIREADSFQRFGKIYEMSLDGCKQYLTDFYGVEETVEVLAESMEWIAENVHVYGQQVDYKRQLPITLIQGVPYACLEYGESGENYGDNISLTGGEKPYELNIPKGDSMSIFFTRQTFNAGNGRVTAGVNGHFYIPKGVIKVHRCTFDYPPKKHK